MPHLRSYSKDEELGKKDDDLKPRKSHSWPLNFLRPPWRRKRFLLLLALAVLVYLFVKTIPTGLGPVDRRLGVPLGPSRRVQMGIPEEPSGPPPPPEDEGQDGEGGKHHYAGPIKFYNLAATLHGISRTMGHRPVNRNVLFAASSLKSAANLIPMACEMARLDRNYVHLVVLGRENLPMDNILDMNAVKSDSCSVYFHDGRADYSEWSTDLRAEIAAAGALNHVNNFMHPQAIIMDDSRVEDLFLAKAVRRKAREWQRAVIEIPIGGYEDFFWISRLDSGSLASWHKPSFDILVHAPPGTSGSLIRLIKSLENADYSGLAPPRLTIELPMEKEPFLQRYLEYLDWPPGVEEASPPKQSSLTLRHRIPSSHLSSEQISMRFLESFYPARERDENVLILSPQAELSPLYMQYLQYTVLEYRYSSYGSPLSDKLLGTSLDVPSSFLNGTAGFVTPTVANMTAYKYTEDAKLEQSSSAPFLYQAPSSLATLYFGDKWAEVHDFFSHRMLASHSGRVEKRKKLVSETEPAWMEYLLELLRARGYSILHPASSLVTIHNELAQLPEEFTHDKESSGDSAEVFKQMEHPEEEAFLTADKPSVLLTHKERDNIGYTQPLHELLPFNGDLPELSHFPLLSYIGTMSNHSEAEKDAKSYSASFRSQVGGCSAEDVNHPRKVQAGKTDDLFCLPGQELIFDSDAEERMARDAKITGVIAEAEMPDLHNAEEEEEENEDEDEEGELELETQTDAFETSIESGLEEEDEPEPETPSDGVEMSTKAQLEKESDESD